MSVFRDLGDDDGLPPKVALNDHAESRSLDLRSLWSAVYRRRFLVLSTVLAFVAVGIVVTFLSTPIYEATARIQIDLQSAKIIEGNDVQPSASGQDADRYLETQVEVIKSRQLSHQVAEGLGLFRSTHFLEQMDIKPANQPAGVYNIAQTIREQTLDALQSHLTVKLPVESAVVSIAFRSPDRQLANQVANSVADTYIVSNLQRKYDTSAYARRFLESQLGQTRQRLEESERAVIDYARNAQLIDPTSGLDSKTQSGGETRSLTIANLIQVNQSYAQAIAARVAAEQKWRETSGSALMVLPEVLNNPTIENLVQERAKLQSDYDQNAGRYSASYPIQRQLAAQIATLSHQIDQVASNLRNSIHQQYDVALSQELGLQKRLSALKGQTLSEQGRSVRYNILRREVDTNRTLYDALLQRYKEISAASGIASNNVSVVDRADPPVAAVWPRPLINLALALMAGVMSGIALVFLLEHLDDAVRSADDVQRKLGLPIVGLIPNLRTSQKPTAELQDSKSELSEAYSALRGSLLLSTPSGPPKTLLITSSGSGEGKSTSSYAIARSFAQIGRRVVLLDADMRKPAQHRNFGIANITGLSNLLAGQSLIDDVLVKVSDSDLMFIPAGPIPLNPAELIAGPGMKRLLEILKERYDLIIVDGPPVLGLADAPALASQVEATLFVVEANKVLGRQARSALDRLRSTKAHTLGALLTKFDARSIGYSNEYSYMYDYGGGTTGK